MDLDQTLEQTLYELNQMQGNLGTWIDITHSHVPQFGAANPTELIGRISFLAQEGYIERWEKQEVIPCRVRMQGKGIRHLGTVLAGNVAPQVQTSSSPSNDISSITANKDNTEHLRRLIEQLKSRGSVIPFVGAGLSMPYKLPGWKAFLEAEAGTWGILPAIKKRLKAGEYEEAAQYLEAKMTSFSLNAAIEKEYGDHRLEGQQLTGPASYIPKLVEGPVITTNFDRVLEKVFEQAGIPFDLTIVGAKPDLIGRVTRTRSRGLLKLHGDWNDRTDRVLTKTEYDTQYGGAGPTSVDMTLLLPSSLSSFLAAHSLLFLGCSLDKDRTVTTLGQLAKVLPGMVHFAIVEDPKTVTKRIEKSSFLASLNILPIYYPTGQHEKIEALLNFLVQESSPHP